MIGQNDISPNSPAMTTASRSPFFHKNLSRFISSKNRLSVTDARGDVIDRKIDPNAFEPSQMFTHIPKRDPARGRRGQRPRLQHYRCEAKTASGSRPETFPTAIQPKRLTSAPSKNEIAANGIAPKNRSTSGIGPVNTSPIRMSQPEPCSWMARSATPCLSMLNQIKSTVSTAAANKPIALSGAIR